MKKKIRAGMTGWDQGSAFLVLKTFNSEYGRVFLVEMVHQEKGFQKLRWHEAVTEKAFKTWDFDPPGHANGELPDPKLFKKVRRRG